jgi:putative transcriptional regulator
VNVLRDLRESTRVLFLHEVTANRHTRLRTIAERLEMTVQGASDYAHALEADGLLSVAGGEYRATKKGIDFLQGRLRELRGFVEQASRSTAFVETTLAFAGAAVRRGDRVGLFMEDGYLVAYPSRESGSMGIANEDAPKGEDVAVRGLEGIVALRPGRIILARVPSSRSLAKRVSPETCRKLAQKGRKSVVATMDVEGLMAARRLRLRPRIEFAPLAGTVAAAERGMDVLLLVPEDRVAEAVEAIEAANARREDKIPYESAALA